MLKNERYTGVYRCGDLAIEGGMPAIVDKETFRAVQARFERNKRMGSQRAKGKDEEGDPRYWPTGKLFCGEFGHSMQSTSGTSMTGITHYYYGCGEHLKRHGCKKRNVRKGLVEDVVLQILAYILDDSEMLASLAVDMASYYRSTYGGDECLKGLKMKEREVDRSLKNVIDAEKAKAALMEDEHGIAAYFQRFAKANLDDPVVRDEGLEYFIDKIYLYDDRLVIVGDFVQYSGSCRYKFGGRVDGFDVRFEIDHDVGSEYDRELEFDQDLQFECFAHVSTMTNQRVAARHSRGPLHGRLPKQRADAGGRLLRHRRGPVPVGYRHVLRFGDRGLRRADAKSWRSHLREMRLPYLKLNNELLSTVMSKGCGGAHGTRAVLGG